MRPRLETVVAVSGCSKREWSCEMNKMPDFRVTGLEGVGRRPLRSQGGQEGHWELVTCLPAEPC